MYVSFKYSKASEKEIMEFSLLFGHRHCIFALKNSRNTEILQH